MVLQQKKDSGFIKRIVALQLLQENYADLLLHFTKRHIINLLVNAICEERIIVRFELQYYDVFPKVVKSGVETLIHIKALNRNVGFEECGVYSVYILPIRERRG